MSADISYQADPLATCPSPDPSPHAPRRFTMPRGAVDTHAHLIGPPPYTDSRSYTPSPATGTQYVNMLDRCEIDFGVLVQVSVHGTDNRLMLDFLKTHPKRFRGVAVIPPDLSGRALQELADSGVKGLRLNAVSKAGVGLSQLDRYEAICKDLGWHLQFITRPQQLLDIAPRLSKLQVPVVIDHMGHFAVSGSASAQSRTVMLDLVRSGAWVKLSGAFRLSDAPPYEDVIPFARALIEAGPTRCVWGSDWPHVSFWKRMPNVGDLLDLLADWAPSEDERRSILVDNAHALYGFEST